MIDKEHTYICFRCGQEGPPIEQRDDKTLGLCSCREGWYVGNILQLCDYLNYMQQQLEDLGYYDYGLDDHFEDEDDIDFHYDDD